MRTIYPSEAHLRNEKVSTSLKHIWLEITEKCNLSCVHCYTASNPHLPLTYGMKIENWINVLTSAKRMGCESVQFIGGEPTIHPELNILLQEAHSLGFAHIEIFTNGTAISSKQILDYKNWNINVALSFYSISPDKHDQITNRKGSYNKTVDFLRRAIEAKLNLRIGIIQIDQSDDEITEVIIFLESLGIQHIEIDKVRKIGRGASSSQIVQNPMRELCGECHKKRICVTSSGETFPCIMARTELLGNVLSQELVDIVDGNLRKQFVNRQKAYLLNVYIQEENFDDSPCNPTHGGTCVPQMGNCNPTQKIVESISQLSFDSPCNPTHGGTCVPQIGNCNPNEK